MALQLRRIPSRSFRSSIAPRRINISLSNHDSRSFSDSVRCQTAQRKSMWAWMATHGKNFHDPLPESTNYLGAYSSSGELLRGRSGGTESAHDHSSKDTFTKEAKPLSKEQGSDLVPFPQNRAFRSERVVNEAMREHIWAKVMKNGQSVKAVSAQLGVEMSRVGAIVRLKEVEKEWARQVSGFSINFHKGENSEFM